MGLLETHICDKCGELTGAPENEYGEYICDDCEQNAAEAAYERHCEDFHDGGATQFISLQEQQAAARRLK
jgi:ribosomal protein L37AE/L43A